MHRDRSLELARRGVEQTNANALLAARHAGVLAARVAEARRLFVQMSASGWDDYARSIAA